jgi:hypothetical protein
MAGWSLIRFAALGGIVAAMAGSSAAHAQDSNCHYFRVQTESVNIVKEPRGGSDFIDALDKNDIVCVTRDQRVGDESWAFISYKLEKRSQRATVNGWATMRSLQPATLSEVTALSGAPGFGSPRAEEGGSGRGGVGAPAERERAQEADCRFFRVQAENLNIVREPRPNADFMDALDRNDIVCVTRDEHTGDGVWAYIAYKVEKRNQRASVAGWAMMRSLQPATPEEISAAGSSAPRAAETGPPPRNRPEPVEPRAAEGGASGRPPESGEQRAAEASGGGDHVPRYAEPIESGPPPVNGHSLEELMKGIPLFSPIEGLDEKVWKKDCGSCHQWTRQTLCQQGQVYIKDAKTELRIPHPYGGPEKIAIMKWARAGCQ